MRFCDNYHNLAITIAAIAASANMTPVTSSAHGLDINIDTNLQVACHDPMSALFIFSIKYYNHESYKFTQCCVD